MPDNKPEHDPPGEGAARPLEKPWGQNHADRANTKPTPRWAVHRRLYDWVLSFAHHKHATTALFVLAFAEASFFPLPPDVLLAPLCMGKRSRTWWFATVTTAGSVLGALLGYLIGSVAWGALQPIFYRYIPGFTPDQFHTVQHWYDHWGVWVLFAAAFTPIPFKVFTITGGVFHQPLGLFILASAVGRAMRFFLVAGLFWWIGPKAMPFIDKYFNWLCLGFTVLLVGGFVAIKLLH